MIPAFDVVVIVTGVFRAVVGSFYEHSVACETYIISGQVGYVSVERARLGGQYSMLGLRRAVISEEVGNLI